MLIIYEQSKDAFLINHFKMFPTEGWKFGRKIREAGLTAKANDHYNDSRVMSGDAPTVPQAVGDGE